MQRLLPTNRDRVPYHRLRTAQILAGMLLAAISAVLFMPWAAAQFRLPEADRRQNSEQDTVYGVYLPTDRSLSRAMARARERLAEHEYHQALGFLHDVLSREEDSFLERPENGADQVGLKATARQLIGELPPEGHDTYELLHGASARRQLESALDARDEDGVAAVVRQFFHTAAGYEAALVLAQMESDQGHYLAAAQLYRQLIDTPRAAARFEPQLSVLTALNQLSAGRPEEANATLRALIEKNPSGSVELFGKVSPLPGLDADQATWLSRLIGKPGQAARIASNWLSMRGDPARNPQSPGGRPLLRPRWQARVVNDPGLEAHLTDLSEEFRQRGVAAIPGARPIAVDDVIVMRTPRNVVAVDWQTGKRLWETRDDEEVELEETPSRFPGGIDEEQFAARNTSLEQRVWDDALVMSLASDGQRVFVLRGVSTAPPEEMMGFQIVGPGFRGAAGEASATTNQLVAYDLATQGKLVWELDGARANGPLAGAFFLGAPLAVDNTLFVMAEIRSAIYLLALDPATGDVRWQQQLVGLEQGIALDPARRLVGATPSYAGGILICPTAASAVVAVDVVKREFAWVYRYPRQTQSPAEMRNIWQQHAQNQSVRDNDHWLDSSAIIAEGRVFLTPPESGELHCLDLRSGKQLWKRRREEALFAGCVDQGRVLLVGADKVEALNATDGTPAWQQHAVSLPTDALSAGQGYLSEGTYYLPLTTGQIAAIDMAAGNLAAFSAGDNTPLGNLICYRGSILSQSVLLLDKFEQLEVLEQRVTTTLAQNPDDATALRELAELKRADGERADAVKSLKRAFELAPNDALTRDMLAEMLLEALGDDYASYRDDVALVARLVRDRTQQIELARVDARGLDQLGKRPAAWEAYLRLADLTAETPAFLRLDADHGARSDRWLGGRLSMLWSEASSKERDGFAAQLADRRELLKNSRTSAEFRHYLSHFGELPGAGAVRRELARLLVDQGRVAEAEIELHQMNDDEQAQITIPRASAADSGKIIAADDAWPAGRVTAKLVPTASNARERRNRNQEERQVGYRPLRIEQDTWPLDSRTHWFISVDGSELVGRNALGDDVFRRSIDPNFWGRQNRDSSLVHGARLGHLLYVAIAGRIMAIDGRQTSSGLEGNLLWQANPGSRVLADTLSAWRTRAPHSRVGRRPVYHAWSDRKRLTGLVGAAVGSLGPVTPRGVVFQDQDELKCVDPLSGETLWVRSDVPPGCELFGDEELVLAADVSARQAYVVRVADGHLVGKRQLPEWEWLLTSGRNVAQLGFRAKRENRALLLRVTDVASQETLFDAEFPIASRTAVVEPNAVAMCDPAGNFQLIDVGTGRIVLQHQLEAVPDLNSIQTLRSGDTLFLFVHRHTQQQQHKPIAQVGFPLIHGYVYAFDLTDGKHLWPSPAVVHNRGLVMSQPEGIPFLVFADRKAVGEGRSGGMQSRLLCIDKHSGQTVYRNDSLSDTSVATLRIRGERYGEPLVSIDTGSGNIQLTVSDGPRPPQPPANDELEGTPEIAERGLLGLTQRMLRGAIENPQTPRQDRPRAEVPQPIDDD